MAPLNQDAEGEITVAKMKSGVFYKGRVPIVRFTLEGEVIYQKRFRKGEDVKAKTHYYVAMEHMMQHHTFAGITGSSEDKELLELPADLLEQF